VLGMLIHFLLEVCDEASRNNRSITRRRPG